MSTKKLEKCNLKIFYPPLGEEQPQRKCVRDLIQETKNSLLYHSLRTGYKQKPVKPKHVRFPKCHPKLQHSVKLFRTIARNARQLCSRYKKDLDIFKELNWIIPHEFFGCSEHRKIFYRLVTKLLSCSSCECVYMKSVIQDFEFKSVPWLDKFNGNKMLWRRYWYFANTWLLEKIVKPIVNRYFFSLKDGHSFEIKFVPKHLWYSYEAKIFNKLKSSNWISEATNCNVPVMGMLHVLPKNGLQDYEKFRLLIKAKSKRTLQHKQRQTIIFNYASKFVGAQKGDFFIAWKDYLSKIGNKKIYAAKIDISDAYGNVDIDVLVNIIGRLPHCSINTIKGFTSYLKNQYITLRNSEHAGKVFKWNHGLLQGGYLSSAFCELYMSYMDKKHLNQFCKPTVFLHRTVDDYFFCSTNPQDVSSFINIMMTTHKVNDNKTQSTEAPHCNKEIEYCGRLINIETKEVGTLYKFKENTRLRYKFKLFNINRVLDKKCFLLRAMYYPYNTFHFNKVVINTDYNSEDKALQNFFHAMIYLAYKFDAAVMMNYESRKALLYGQILADTLWHYSRRSLGYINKFKGENNKGSIKFLTLVKIGYQAFLLVLKRRSKKYELLINEIEQVSALIRLKYYRPDDFRKMPPCFLAIRMSRVLNIVKK